MRYSWVSGLLLTLAAVAAFPAVSEEQSISISNGVYSIPGMLSLPSVTAGPAPAVLLLHGTASQKNEVDDLYMRLAKPLMDAGIASLRIDFAGAADTTAPYQQSVDLLSQSTHPMSQLVLLAGADHIYNVLPPMKLSKPRSPVMTDS
ncbi:alpha/beta hydrolase family protein [Congregibacter sp.]|jgi:hypothetical protein|uniref:alpha/beta hydrolase family protein n=1 Tax=Congregibacter sp. TaxID=2744308 RepID=UPI0039E4DB41